MALGCGSFTTRTHDRIAWSAVLMSGYFGFLPASGGPTSMSTQIAFTAVAFAARRIAFGLPRWFLPACDCWERQNHASLNLSGTVSIQPTRFTRASTSLYGQPIPL